MRRNFLRRGMLKRLRRGVTVLTYIWKRSISKLLKWTSTGLSFHRHTHIHGQWPKSQGGGLKYSRKIFENAPQIGQISESKKIWKIPIQSVNIAKKSLFFCNICPKPQKWTQALKYQSTKNKGKLFEYLYLSPDLDGYLMLTLKYFFSP